MIGALPRRHRLAVASLRGLAVAALVACAVVLAWPGDRGSELGAWLASGVAATATVLCLTRAVLDRQERAAWLCMGAGLACYEAGNVVYLAWIIHLDPQPFPSVVDALFLAFYPFAYATLVLLVRRRVSQFHRSLWLDGVIGGLGAAAIGAALAFQTIVDATGGAPASAVATNLAYPLADLLLLVLVVGVVALMGWRPGRAWLLLATGFVLFALADTLYLFRVASGTYLPGTWLEVVWPAAILIIGLAAWSSPRAGHPVRMEGWTVLVVPSLFAVSSLGVLLLDHFTGISTLAAALATGCLLACVVRTVAAFLEVRSLSDSRRQAHTDDLTGLGNRRLLHSEMNAALKPGGKPQKLALLVVDLDRFKEINDAFGHEIGDRLLRLVGPRLERALIPVDVLVRLGADEFAVLVREADVHRAAEVATRLLSVLDTPFTLEGVALHIDASIGIAVYPDHAADGAELLQRADIAMYQAKEARTGWHLYDAEPTEYGRGRLQLIEDLRAALTTDQLVLHYQPKVDAASRQVVGVEALVRWQHPTQGLLYPDTFLPVAEQTRLMRSLASAVLQMALEQAAAWRNAGRHLAVAVNLSVANLLDAHLPLEVARLLTSFHLPPTALELEITESTLMIDPVRSKEVLEALRGLGVRLAVDDYGTGYSSLAYLRELAVDELKLDKSFVIPMLENPDAAAIVRSTVDLAHALGLRMVAEGVESEEHLLELARLGCDVAQGYHISRPVPAAQLDEWLRVAPAPSSSATHPTW
ncbi:MAG TPA: EAL domain-containing protein [Actinomycetota bacterium]|nr:EAL domain-containing protein [Actinomycetota bacterium]